jgi:hypothetical protein
MRQRLLIRNPRTGIQDHQVETTHTDDLPARAAELRAAQPE